MKKMISRWFSEDEMRCKTTGRCEMRPDFMSILDSLREEVNVPLFVTSGFRDPSHPEELKKKDGPGAHALGVAADIACSGLLTYRLVKIAQSLGVQGIGLQQSLTLPPEKRFVHLDIAAYRQVAPRPSMWSY